MFMMYFIADTHLNHDTPFAVNDRGFQCATQMNELIIRNWNEVVRSDDDIVIVLGDFILGSNVQTKEIAEQLRGTI